MPRPLVVIPTYMDSHLSYALTRRCLMTLAGTAAEDCDAMVIDDGSPATQWLDELEKGCANLGIELVRKSRSGFSSTVNVGLAQARSEGRDAILCNADIEFFEHGWVDALDTGSYVTGGQLFYPNGVIQHAGVYYSVHTREFDHIFRGAPNDLPEAQMRRACPVTGALQRISHNALSLVGLYDEGYRMGYEDVDYCLRVLDFGRTCTYEPKARAFHHENAFRGRLDDEQLMEWSFASKKRLYDKFAGTDISALVPNMLLPKGGIL